MWEIMLPIESKIFPATKNSSYLGLGIFSQDFYEDQGKAVLSKTGNCSGVNLVNAVLSDLAITLD